MQLRVSIKSAGYGRSAVVKDIRFNLQEGQLLAVIGPNGSGKTTLIRAISRVLPVVEGEVHINGTDILQANENECARMMAVVPQSTYVPPSFLVQDVVRMGRTPYINWSGKGTREDEKFVRQAMAQTDVVRFKNQLCGELSAGERQRVILARALAQDTPVLLMDEPTSHLDLRYQIEFLELTRSLRLNVGKTVLVAMHDLNLAARFGDKFLALKNGTTDSFGSAQDVLLPEKLSQIYGLSVRVIKLPNGSSTVVIPE